MDTILPLLFDWLTIGDLARLHEAMCDRSASMTVEVRHVVRSRLRLRHPPPTRFSLVRSLSAFMTHARSRCRECGAPCRRRSHVCFRCADDPKSYRAMVTRNDLRVTSDGWRIRERRLLQALSTVRIVACTSTGAYLYWRREALASLSQ